VTESPELTDTEAEFSGSGGVQRGSPVGWLFTEALCALAGSGVGAASATVFVDPHAISKGIASTNTSDIIFFIVSSARLHPDTPFFEMSVL
jgi:hypothetical protein